MRAGSGRIRTWLERDWPYWAGGLAFALLNTALLVYVGRPWGVTTAAAQGGAAIISLLGSKPQTWTFFRQLEAQVAAGGAGLYDGLVINGGVLVGALLSTLLASQFRIRRLKTARQALVALAGGLLMGYGARLALGCNVGGLVGGISSLSLHGWVHAVFLVAGAYLGSRFVARF